MTTSPTPTSTLPPPPTPSATKWRLTGYGFAELSALDEAMRRFMQERDIPGGTLAITDHSKLVYARGYTLSDDLNFTVQPHSKFRLASVSKMITSAATMKLVQEKKLDLSATVTSLLKLDPLPNWKRDARLDKIAVLELLQHLGGWDRDKSFDPMGSDAIISQTLGQPLPINHSHIITYMSGYPLDYDPGTKYAYSNYGYMLLGRIIEVLSGQPYAEYVSQKILAPLKMTHTSLGRSQIELRMPDEVTYYSSMSRKSVLEPTRKDVPGPYGSFNLENHDANGGWVSSAIDMARFAVSFDNPNTNPVLSRDSIETTFAVPAIGMQTPGFYYGCGWEVRQVSSGRNTWHNGALLGTYTYVVRLANGINWITLFNRLDDTSPQALANYARIDPIMNSAIRSITNWPTYELFDTYS